MIKRTLYALAGAIALAGSIVLATPPTTALASACQGNGTGCTKAGTYTENALINSDYSGFKFAWVKSVVASYPSGSIPVTWTAYVRYTNTESDSQTLSCPGDWPDASYVSEDLSGGSGDTGGSVSAGSTTCSQDPSLSVTVSPGATYTSFATFPNVPWPGTAVAITWGDAGTSPYIYPFGSGDTDWAGPSFCSSHYSQPALSYSNWGVTPCGQPFNPSGSNDQGPIKYQGFTIDSVGFQCVELAARYFWFDTTRKPPHPLHAKDFVAALHSEYPQYAVTGNTDTFSSSLKPGQIISMGDGTNDSADGHVGVVTAVSVSNGKGTITMMDENASATGKDTITVSGGKFTNTSVGAFAVYAWTTNLPH
jgi:hypothetical protein